MITVVTRTIKSLKRAVHLLFYITIRREVKEFAGAGDAMLKRIYEYAKAFK